ncbi:MAG: type II secretion system minor pseudopilin GspK [Nitrospiraceae bacterium]|nr:type II secretion system minor pseudopilin GspK [Nitrospiraceae bacterium]
MRPGKKPFTFHLSPFTEQRGMALVLTLMIVALITAMVVEFAYGVYVNTNALHNWQTSQELSVTARSATKLASRLIAASLQDAYTKGVFEIGQKIPFEDLDGTITLRIEDENAKFNLNVLGHTGFYRGAQDIDANARFVRLLKELQLNPEIADRIADWIDSDSEPRLGDSENGAKNADLDSVDELLLIPGIDMETYEKFRPYVTIYTDRDSRINVNGADVPVLMSLSDSIDRDLAQRIVSYRNSEPFQQISDIKNVLGMDDKKYTSLQGLITTKGSSFHVIATAESGGVKRIVESVLAGSSVLYWKEM